MNWKEALAFAKELKCPYTAPAALEAGPGKYPDENQPATVLCKRKVRQGILEDTCGKLDGSYCPLNR